MSHSNPNNDRTKRSSSPTPVHPMGKTKVATTIHTESNSVNENGMTETTVTRIITEKYSDGTTSTRREIRTTREEQLVGNSGQGYFQPITGNTGSNTSFNFGVPNTGGESLISQQQQQHQYQTQQQVPGMSLEPIQTQQATNIQQNYQAPGYFIDPRSPKAALLTEESFIQQALLAHNRHRSRHAAPPLSLSEELCQVAQSWANHLAESGVMSNSHYGYGENIYWSSAPAGTFMRGDVPVDYWYNEISQFDWYKMDFQKTTGAFTQVIWKGTNQFGIAKATGGKGTFVVAFYVPPGNVVGQFRQNVERAIM